MRMPEPPIPEEAVEAAFIAVKELRLDRPMYEPPMPREEAEAAVQAAAPAIRKQLLDEVREALEEQAAEYRRQASEARRRGEQGGWEKLSAAADVVGGVTRIISEPGAALDILEDSDQSEETDA